jgi:hypothetical protein
MLLTLISINKYQIIILSFTTKILINWTIIHSYKMVSKIFSKIIKFKLTIESLLFKNSMLVIYFSQRKKKQEIIKYIYHKL